MAVFTYTALRTDGQSTRGTLPAESRAAAISALMTKGLTPVQVAEQGTARPAPAAAKARPPGRVKPAQVEAFTRELANLLAGGVPLSRALMLLKREAAVEAARHLWGEIHDAVVDGTSLADALAAHPQVFSTVYVAMVRAGETGGFLDLVLNQIAEFRAREQELKGKVVAALVYPCVLASLAVGVMIFLMTYFIPRFSGIFSQFGKSLPLLTQIIIAISQGVTRYGPYAAVLLLGAVLLLRRTAQTDAGRRKIERAILSVPKLGNVIAAFALVRFCRMLGTLLTAGVPLVAALKVAKEAIGNQTLADTVAHGIDEVQRGASLARSLTEAGKLFPPSAIEMIAIAEETGRLDKELVRLSVTYESDLDRRLRMLVALVEPLLLLCMAAMIGTIVVGMLLPVINMQDLIK